MSVLVMSVLNAELRRNLWLQFSWARLLAAPVLLATIFAAYHAITDATLLTTAEFAEFLFGAIIAFWSTRRAADALSEEVSAATWETQRMSSLSAGSMALGKLFGGTSYVWYCALICLGVMIGLNIAHGRLTGSEVDQWGTIALNLAGAILAQAASLTVALLLLRKGQARRRLAVTMAQIVGIVVFAVATGWESLGFYQALETEEQAWFGWTFNAADFRLGSVIIFMLWALLSVWRLMAAELLYRLRPWVWLFFSLFLIIYVAGLVEFEAGTLSPRWLMALLVSIFLTYGAFFAEAKDVVRYRWGLARMKSGRFLAALEHLPWWLINFSITAILAAIVSVLSFRASGAHLPGFLDWLSEMRLGDLWLAAFSVALNVSAMLCFMARDLTFLLWLNLGPWRQRADLTGFIMLLIAYWAVPGFLKGWGLDWALPAVLPFATDDWTALAWPIGEVILLLFMIRERWRSSAAIESAS